MKVERAFLEAVEILKKNSIASPFLDARIMLAKILNCDSQDIILKYSQLDLTSNQYQEYLNSINLRATRVPLSHLTNHREFFGNNFFIDNSVLDPRPDSETLIELLSDKYQNRQERLRICEVGVGSGCLIISLLKLYKNWLGIGLDISETALKIAQKNAQTNDVESRISLIQSDIFSSLQKDCLFDIIISNPPYIPSSEIEKLQDEVKIYEPRIALDGGFDGLEFYRKIADNCAQFLKISGSIFLEIGHNQHNDVIKIFESRGIKFLDSKKDLNGIIRILEFAKKI